MNRRFVKRAAAIAFVVGLVLTVSALPAMAHGSNDGRHGSQSSWNPASWSWWW